MGAFALGVVDITVASEMTLNYAYYLFLLVLLLITSTFGGVITTFWLVNITLC